MNIKKLLVAFICFLSFTSFSQNLDKIPYVQGEVLIQIDDNKNIRNVTNDLFYVNGVKIDINIEKSVSKPTNIWLLSFDETKISHAEIINHLYNQKNVRVAQNNHYVTDRATTPNDTDFGSQWHHINNGGSGGTADADIDSDEAWDITTGGLTALGDEIVVCVLEGGGADWDHPDLIDNHWVNVNEIPNDGIDNDNNGYVDDYNGWNEPNGNDIISAGNHGTQVSGMIGAKGNNSSLVTGINWDVKIMQVQNGSIGNANNPNEANVIAAYTYPLIMRKMYNASGGTEGAFVVATNASWGIDQADPANAPLWCGFYDTLGVHGILNCGATTNSALDVDAVGDLPTACSSDYMISVTATDNTDVRDFSGYGQTTIDVGAPGSNIYTTSNGGGAGNTSGTSFASPLTAGTIGLLYSVPCPSLIALAKANPQQAADQIRTALLNGVDPKANLTTETVTGGRINAFNSLNLLLTDCDSSSCITPFAIASANVTDVNAEISWGSVAASGGFNIQYREQGSSTWTTISSATSPNTLNGLTACTTYEVQIQSQCSGSNSSYSQIFTFQTDGCCEAPSTITPNVTSDTEATINWNNVLAATSYNARYKATSSSTWVDITGATFPLNLTGLDVCEEYEFQIQTVCVDGPTAYSPSVTFTTTGCGACFDITYCPSNSANSATEWIETVELNTINNTSGNDGGYADFSGISTDLEQDESYDITLTPGYSFLQYSEYFNAWIDYNHDGDFDDAGEHVYDAGNVTTVAVTGNFTVPTNATLGLTKMRVSMRYNQAAGSCDTGIDYGEIEDYCVNIVKSTGIHNLGSIAFKLFPNPTNQDFTLETEQGSNIEIYNELGELVYKQNNLSNIETISIANVPVGIYMVKLSKSNRISNSKLIVTK